MKTLPEQPLAEQHEPAFAGIATLAPGEGGQPTMQSLVLAEGAAPAIANIAPAQDMGGSDKLANPSWHDRFYRSRMGRLATRALVVLGAFGGVGGATLAEATPAHAAVVQHVKGADGEGLWLHPNAATIHSDLSDLMPEGQSFDVQCFSIGDSISGDTAWLYGTNEATGQTGYAADYYMDTDDTQGNEAQQLPGQGVPECGTQQQSSDVQTNPQPAESVPVFASYDRQAAVDWALSQARSPEPSDGACTWFTSHVLWAGGLPKTSDWNDYWYDSHGRPTALGGSGIRMGTKDAWAAPNLIQYLSEQPYVEVEPLGHMDASNNNIPDAKPGDIIAYVWDGDGLDTGLGNLDKINHLSVVVDDAQGTQYPEVAEWGIYGSGETQYQKRGWTWSVKDNTWLQDETDQNGNHTNQNMFAYLVHINSEDDLNIGG